MVVHSCHLMKMNKNQNEMSGLREFQLDSENKGLKNKQLCSDDQHLVDEDVEDFKEKPSESISSENITSDDCIPDIPAGEVLRDNSPKPSKNSYVMY